MEDDSSASSDGEDGSSSDEDDDFKTSLEPGLVLDKSAINLPSSDAIAENEFRAEVTQSLERAFAEGHSIDNAAVELKTLRMASNVPLSRVREAVVAAIVERVRIVESGGAAQRAEITNVIQRWGGLIDRIGGVDAVETISVLQVKLFHVLHMTDLLTKWFRPTVHHPNGCLCSVRYLQLCTRQI